jgi:hypothetical protein
MGAFDRWSDGPDRDSPTEVTTLGKLPKVVEFSALAETGTRGEAYANTRQSAESGWERHRLFDAPRAELARFRTERAGLLNISPDEAARYIEQHRAGRPWLQVAERASPESRRIMAALDQSAGHGHIRHDGWVTEEANMRRAAYLEDPAQLCIGKRLRGIDGLKPDGKRHRCGPLATRITDPDAPVPRRFCAASGETCTATSRPTRPKTPDRVTSAYCSSGGGELSARRAPVAAPGRRGQRRRRSRSAGRLPTWWSGRTRRRTPSRSAGSRYRRARSSLR